MKLPESGYTIVEVLVFTAVSAAMLFLALVAFNGRQADVEFTQAVRDLDSRLTDVINDVSTGFFNNAGNLDCSINMAGDVVVTTSGTPASQGASNTCIFLGKAIQFEPDSGAGQFNIMNILGRRKTDAGATVTNLDEAQPTAVALASTVENNNLQWGMVVEKVVVDGSPATEYGTIGFFSSFAKSVGDSEVSNAQAVRYAPIPSSMLGETPTLAASRVNNANYTTIDLSSQQEVVLCLGDGNGSKAAIIIGGGGNTGTEVQFDSALTSSGGLCG